MDAKELHKLADDLKGDKERRHRLLRWIGNRTEVEMYSIMSKCAAWYYMFRDYPLQDRGEKEFLRFLCAAAWRRNHRSHNAKYLAAVWDERDARKSYDAKKSLLERLTEDLGEIDAYRANGMNWVEIRQKLKETHRRKYHKKKLTVETLRKYYRKAKELQN